MIKYNNMAVLKEQGDAARKTDLQAKSKQEKGEEKK